MMDAKLKKALVGLIMYQPFWGSLVLRLNIVEDPSCRTAWVDGKTLGYNPGFINSLTLDETKAVLAHEVMHCVLAHHVRRGDRKPEKWNRACDYPVNETLVRGGFTLPGSPLRNPQWADYSADLIYNLLPDEDSKGGGQEQQKGSSSKDGSSPSGSDNSQGQNNPDKGKDCGEAGTKQKNQQDVPGSSNPDPGGCGEVRDCTNDQGQAASPAEMAQSEREWKVALSQASAQAKAMGRMPAGLERLIETVLEPKVNWAEALRNFLETVARNDYSWMRPNRNYLSRGFYAPSLYSREIGEMVVAVDTSGSISQRELEQFAAELSSILEEYDTTVHVIYCDTKINAVEVFGRDDLPLKLNPYGGGGTDFRPPFDWVGKEEIAPACLVYLTDLYCSSSRQPLQPDYPVLWVYPEKKHGIIPEWGEAIPIS